MNKFIAAMIIVLSYSAGHALTINVASGELYQGAEFVNEQATGRACYLYLDQVEVNPIGLHCFNLTTRPVFFTDRDLHPKDDIVVLGRITNFHRPEYSHTKTCATSLDGKTSGQDIYGQETEQIYSQFFTWAGEYKENQYDFFVTFSPETKKPSRARLHKMNWMSETNYDCVNLQKM